MYDMVDENDIIFQQRSIDFLAVVEAVGDLFGGASFSGADVVAVIQGLWGAFIVISFLLAALFLVGYIYAAIRLNQLAEIQSDGLKEQEKLWQQLYGTRSSTPSRIDDIAKHVDSDNPNDWKLAIIEADIELERLLDEAGHYGSTVGEKLKGARASGTLQAIDAAWDAHLVRNKIAHRGADFILTKRLAQQTITQYRQVFAELQSA